MKKKAIEKISYMKLPKINRSKSAKYIGVTAIKIVDHEKHLFLEVYRNNKNAKEIPVVRVVMSKKDFGTYFPETGTWSRAKINSNEWYDAPIWVCKEERMGKTYQDRRKENVLQSTEDLQRIKTFCDVKYGNYDQDWWKYIESAQDHIACTERNARRHRQYERRHRQYERRQQALNDRIANTPELPEQDILRWADRKLFQNKHYIYYKKKGRRATICCSGCGGLKEGSWKSGESFESMYEPHIEEPRDGTVGKCPMCGIWGTYKPQGKVKTWHSVKAYTFIADRYKETGAVIRYIQLEKRWQLEQTVGNTGISEMVAAYEKLEGVEIARTYFEKDKQPQTDFHKHNPYSGKDYWDDCNLYGLSNISVKEAPLYPGFAEKLKGTILQYSAIELYEAAVSEVNARDYLERYQQTPQIEMLVKLKLCEVVKELVRCRYGIVANQNANRPDEFLGIRKEKLKLLMKEHGDADLLSVLQMEKRMKQNWTDEQIEALREIRATQRDIELVVGIMTLQKALNQIIKYAGCEFGSGCSHAIARIRHTATTYFDYLSMRAQLGYNLENTVYQRPRNLEAAHNKLVAEIDKSKQDKRLMEVAERYPLIRKHYRKLRNKFLYEDDNFIIRPARSAEEIVREGRILHHCVGGDNYLRKHNEQESVILMLRYKAEPEVPYITVEIRNESIVQWYGSHDKKPDEKNMQRWLDAYVVRLKCRQSNTADDPELGDVQQMLAYA